MASDSLVQLPSGRVQTSNKAQNNNQKAPSGATNRTLNLSMKQNPWHHTTMALTSIHESFPIAYDFHQGDGLGLFQFSFLILSLSQTLCFSFSRAQKISSTAQHPNPSPDENSMGKPLWFARRNLKELIYRFNWPEPTMLPYSTCLLSPVMPTIGSLSYMTTGIDHLLASTENLLFQVWTWPSSIACSFHQVEENMRPCTQEP